MMTKREYFMTHCSQSDLCAIYRYAMTDLSAQFEGKPVWEREEILEQWLDQPLDAKKWNAANAPEHRVPRGI